MRPTLFATVAAALCCVPFAEGAGTPSVNSIQNNYSYIPPGLPNYGIAPGSLFIVWGSNLNDQPLTNLQSSAPPGLPIMLNGTSIAINVNGVTITPGLYYTSPTQLAAVLPSNTPIATGTLVVINNGQTSAEVPIQVVPSALGLASYYGNGSGLALAQDANYTLLSPVNSAAPGQTIILWGSGVGADLSNDDKTFPMEQNNLTGIPMTVFIGGMEASIAYRGRSQFPGVDQIVVTIPADAPQGCAVSIVAVSGTVVSNTVTLPISTGGGSCIDPVSPETASQFQSLADKDTINLGAVFVMKDALSGMGSAGAYFYQFSSSQLAGQLAGTPSLGSCVINPPPLPGNPVIVQSRGLYITLFGSGLPSFGVQIPYNKSFAEYYGSLFPYIPSDGGSFTFYGPAGNFSLLGNTVKLPSTPVVLTNQNPVTADRAQGVTISWSGGAQDSYVRITGEAITTSEPSVSASFVCDAPASAGQFAVPSWVTLALPDSNFSIQVSNVTNFQSYPIEGLDISYGYGAVGVSGIVVSYK